MHRETLFPIAEQRDPEPRPRAEARFKSPVRTQVEIRFLSLDELVDSGHRARLVWAWVERLDLSGFYGKIKARGNTAGRDPVDPRLLPALWILATLDGIAGARELGRRCAQDLGCLWLCGGVSVNYHLLSSWRWNNADTIDALLADSLACLMNEGLVELKRVALDGMKTRAAAGADTYRTRPTLERHLEEAKEHIARLRRESGQQDGKAASRRQAAARQRAARERAQRLEHALGNMRKLEEHNEKQTPSKKKGPEKLRVSTTDPDIPVMKMGDGGFRPAVNVQMGTDTCTQIIMAWDVSAAGCDHGQMTPMLDQFDDRHGQYPRELLVDGGYVKGEDIEHAARPEVNCVVYSPPHSTVKDQDPHAPNSKDTPAVAAWRERMATGEAKQIYRQRASTAECVNADARNRGLHRFTVRGLRKISTVPGIFVLAHNLMRAHALRTQRA